MPDAYSYTTQYPDLTILPKYLSKRAILTLLPNLELYKFGREAMVAGGNGKECYIPAFVDDTLSDAKVASEGTHPTVRVLDADRITGTLVEHADAIGFGRFLWNTKSVPLLEEATKQLMVSIGKSWESVIKGVIEQEGKAPWVVGDVSDYNATKSVFPPGVSDGALLTPQAFSAASTILAQNNNPGFEEFGGMYGAVIHPVGAHHLKSYVSQTSTNAGLSFRADSMNRMDMFRGRPKMELFNVVIYESPFSPRTVATATVEFGFSNSAAGYVGFVFAPEAFAVSPLSVSKPEIIMHGFGSAGTKDPANQDATIAAYAPFIAFTGTGATDEPDLLGKRMVFLTHGDTLSTAP